MTRKASGDLEKTIVTGPRTPGHEPHQIPSAARWQKSLVCIVEWPVQGEESKSSMSFAVVGISYVCHVIYGETKVLRPLLPMRNSGSWGKPWLHILSLSHPCFLHYLL